jgi:hypothetical protein
MITPTKKYFSICCGAIMYNWPDEQRCPLCHECSGAEDCTEYDQEADDLRELELELSETELFYYEGTGRD